jgi:hypothetical protein
MGFLKIAATNFRRWNLSCDRKHWHTAPMSIEEPIDEMQVSRSARTCTDRQIARDVRLTGCSEGGDLFMPHVNPFDGATPSQRFCETVQTVSNDPEDSLYACLLQGCHDEIGDIVDCHRIPPVVA